MTISVLSMTGAHVDTAEYSKKSFHVFLICSANEQRADV